MKTCLLHAKTPCFPHHGLENDTAYPSFSARMYELQTVINCASVFGQQYHRNWWSSITWPSLPPQVHTTAHVTPKDTVGILQTASNENCDQSPLHSVPGWCVSGGAAPLLSHIHA